MVVASLGLATVGSIMLWLARRITWRRPTPFLKKLEAVSGAPGRSVGPASGISRLDPLKSDPSAEAPADAPGDAPAVPER